MEGCVGILSFVFEHFAVLLSEPLKKKLLYDFFFFNPNHPIEAVMTTHWGTISDYRRYTKQEIAFEVKKKKFKSSWRFNQSTALEVHEYL